MNTEDSTQQNNVQELEDFIVTSIHRIYKFRYKGTLYELHVDPTASLETVLEGNMYFLEQVNKKIEEEALSKETKPSS